MQSTGEDFSNIYEIENLRCRISALSSLLCPGKKEIFIIYRIHWNTIGRVFFFFLHSSSTFVTLLQYRADWIFVGTDISALTCS